MSAGGSLFDALSRKRVAADVTEIVRFGRYLGVPVLVVEEEADGWVLTLWPDRRNPGRSHGAPKPFTYGKGEWWRQWAEQVLPFDEHSYVPLPLPLTLVPKPEPDDA